MITKTTHNLQENFCLITDSGCDLPHSYLDDEGIICIQLGFYFESDEKLINGCDLTADEFYKRVQNGELAKTSAPSPDAFECEFRKVLDMGRDILYIGLDSALSTTFNSARMAAAELKEEYPDRTILVLDSLCASAGQGMLVALTKNKMKTGVSLREAYEYAENLIPKISHRFTVETLTYLCRGGRISKSAAMAGNLLNIKPVLHVNDEGKLISLYKARGRIKSLSMLLDAYEETSLTLVGRSTLAAGAENITIPADIPDESENMIMISHAGCYDDAVKLSEMIKSRFNRTVDMICDIGPVIGSHAGPGTIALFFLASER